jgi:hypothetical protein
MGLYFLRKILEFLCVDELCSHARENSKIFRTKQESLSSLGYTKRPKRRPPSSGPPHSAHLTTGTIQWEIPA